MADNPFSITLTEGADTYRVAGFPFDIPKTVYALGGNDDVTVTAGWETILYMGDGDDVVHAEAGIAIVYGENGNDRVDADGGVTSFHGGPGDDTLNANGATVSFEGGPGNDTLSGTAAHLNGVAFADFSPGDKIVVTDATLASFTFSISGGTLTYTGGSLTLTSVHAGNIVATAAAGGGVQLAFDAASFQTRVAANDLNGDGRSDILWRNDNGALTDWLGSLSGGFTANGNNLLTAVDPSWQIAGTGDFNGDGRVDVLWHRVDGSITDWLGTPTGGLSPNAANLLTVVDASWQIAAVGDFNGDGRSDVLWHRSDGTITDWLGTASGGLDANSANLLTVVDTQWHIAAVGDFNGDGRDDVLWHRSDGATTTWLGTASGGLAPNGNNFLTVVDPQWQIAGVGDFNGDGKDDVLWHRTDAATTDWLGNANGSFTGNSAAFLSVVDTQWQVVAIGDYNGDGRDDILWRNNDGRITNWLGTANGAFTDNAANALNAVDTHWHIQPDHGATGAWDY